MKFSKIVDLIGAHLERGRYERQRWDKWHSWYLGDFYETMGELDRPDEAGDDDELTLETNIPYAFIDTMAANICPPNPSVTINALNPAKAEPAKARARFANEMMRRDKMKQKSRRYVSFMGICGRGVSRTTWDARAKRTTTIVIDPRFFFYDMAAPTWDDVTYCFEATAIRKSEFDKRVAAGRYPAEVAAEVKATAYPEWMKDRYTTKTFLNKDNRDLFEWVVIYDFYDFIDDRFYQIAESMKDKPLFVGDLPYVYARNPYIVKTFNEDLRSPGGISDIKLIEKALERLNEMDTLELWHAHSSIPVPVVNKNLLTKPEDALSMLATATGPRQVAVIDAKGDVPISSIMDYTRVPSMNPSWDKMRDRSEQRIQFTLGLPEYSRGTYGKGELATEVALSNEATNTRNGWRIDVVQEWVVEVAKISMAIWMQYMKNDRQMFIKPPGEETASEVNRMALDFPQADPITGKLPSDLFDDDWYQYEAVAYSPPQNTRLVKMQALQQFMPVLLNLPNVDKNKLVKVLLEVIGLESEALDVSMQQPTMQMPGTPGAPGASGIPGTPAPMGMVPPGTSPETEALLPPDVRTGGGASPPIVGNT